MEHQLRLRIFAGPNGSGKSTVIDGIRHYKINGQKIDFGYYINADNIVRQLNDAKFSFDVFNITVTNKEFKTTALESGLIKGKKAIQKFENSYSLRKSRMILKDKTYNERLAQLLLIIFAKDY